MDTALPSRSSSLSRRRAPTLRVYGLLVGLCGALGVALWLVLTPYSAWLAGALLGAYGVAVALRPALWLTLLPALWPVVDLTAWSGEMYLAESDALALATLLGLGLREALAPPPVSFAGRAPVKVGPAALLVFGLLLASTLISGARGLLPLQPLDYTALMGYSSTLNALRIAKALFLALALIPFLHAALRRDGEAALARLMIGLALGLASCALAALWERGAFPGFSNFSADYRTTALFWEMHVGGAALDGWLMLSFPFAVAWLLRSRQPAVQALALAAVCLGAYAIFTTFSRVVYGASFVSAAVLVLCALRRPQARATAAAPRAGVLLVLCGAVLAGCFGAFSGGGYRGLAAFGGLALVAYAGGGALAGMRGGRLVGGMLAGLALLPLTALALVWLPKGAYLVFALAWVGAAVAAWRAFDGRGGPAAQLLLIALLTWTAANALVVGSYWGGNAALPGMALAVALVLAALLLQALAPRPLWVAQVSQLYALAAVLAVGGMIVATLGSFYMESRMATSDSDLQGRMAHWRDSAGLVRSATDSAIGIGIGRYADAYFWHLPDQGLPGTVRLTREDGNYAMLITATRHPRNVGEPIRLTQQVPINTSGPFRYRLRARTRAATTLTLEICRKHLLYRQECVQERIGLTGDGAWHDYAGLSQRGDLPAPRGGLPRLTSFALSLDGASDVEVDDVDVSDGNLRPLLRNGDFEQGPAFWFFTSDHDHVPWHAKNMLVHLYVEHGVLGLLALGMAALALLPRLLRPPAANHPLMPAVLAALAGLFVVGMVDSLIDMPRLMFFAYLVLWLGLTLRRSD